MMLDRDQLTVLESGVWGAAYVRILSAIPPSFPVNDHHIHKTAEFLADPTPERAAIAAQGADEAVLTLRRLVLPSSNT